MADLQREIIAQSIVPTKKVTCEALIGSHGHLGAKRPKHQHRAGQQHRPEIHSSFHGLASFLDQKTGPLLLRQHELETTLLSSIHPSQYV